MKNIKKTLALALALILAVSVAVPAFADTEPFGIKLIEASEKAENDDGMLEIVDYSDHEILDKDNKTTGKFLVGPEAADYYFWFGSENELKNIKIAVEGNLAAKIVKYDHNHMFCSDQEYYVALANDKTKEPAKIVLTFTEGGSDKIHVSAAVPGETDVEADLKLSFAKYGEDVDDDFKGKEGEYAFYEDLVKALNTVVDTKKFRVVDVFGENEDKYVLVKVTTKDNYGVAYNEGVVKLTAECKIDGVKKTVNGKITVISDVNIFDSGEVEWAAETGYDLDTHDANGYSDYLSTKKTGALGYLDDGAVVTVVASSDFAEIKGEDLGIVTRGEGVGSERENLGMDVEVQIKDIAAKQKAINFAFKGPHEVDKNGTVYDENKLTAKQIKDWETYGIEFGFPCAQVVSSATKVVFTFDNFTNLDLADMFGADFEKDEDIVFHVLKDGKEIGEYKVDYADRNEVVELTIDLDAGNTLGMYRLQLEKEAKEEKEAEGNAEGETNPDTGAPIEMIGVISAIGVVATVAGAALVISKKRK